MVRRSERGFTFIELLVVTTILIILASAIATTGASRCSASGKWNSTALREIRCHRQSKDAVDTGRRLDRHSSGSESYHRISRRSWKAFPKANDASGIKLKFLRRVPMDRSRTHRVGMRRRTPDSSSWQPERYDVPKAEGRARRDEKQGLVRTASLVHLDNEDGQKASLSGRGREVGLAGLVVSAASR